jgi:hypothetical protein
LFVPKSEAMRPERALHPSAKGGEDLMTEIMFATRVRLGNESARGVQSCVGVFATQVAPSFVTGHATAGSLGGFGATRMSAVERAGTWRDLFRGLPQVTTPAPVQATNGTTVDAAAAAASIKRYMINKNGTKVSKGSSPWRFPV